MLVNGNLDILGFLRGLKPDTRISDPEGAELVGSLVWINSTEGTLKWYDGTNVHVVAHASTFEEYLRLDGGTMTGALVLSADAVADLEAVTLQQLQAGLDTKENNIEGAASSITTNNLDAEIVVVSSPTGKVASSGITITELNHLDGVEANIQEQIDSKQPNIGYVTVNKAGDTMSGDLNFDGAHTVTNLKAPTEATDAVRLIDIDNLTANLDFQADVLAMVTNDELVPTTTVPAGMEAVRYIILDAENINAAFGTITGLEDNDIVAYEDGNWFVAYDVSEKGPGALTWNRESERWKKWDGTQWTEHGGLSGVTTAAGLSKEGNTIMVDFGGGTTVSPEGGVMLDIANERGLVLVDPVTGEASTGEDAVLATLLRTAGGLNVTEEGLGIVNGGVNARTINSDIIGLGIQGGMGDAISVKLDGTSLEVDEDGLRLGDVSGEYLSRTAETSSVAGQVSVPAPTADSSIANKKYVDDADILLQEAITAVNTRLTSSQYVYDGTLVETDTFVITHNMGNKFVSVIVYDENDSMIIPDSVVLTDNNNVTVTLESAMKVRIVINGNKVA